MIEDRLLISGFKRDNREALRRIYDKYKVELLRLAIVLLGDIRSLRKCFELLGNYPGSLSIALDRALQVELDKSNSPAATRLKEELKELSEEKKTQRLMDIGTPMWLLFEFYIGLIEDRKDPTYYGKIVTPKDADKVLLRWKVSDNEYRVIFGDLHAEPVSPEKLAELEKAVPK